jgi:PAS domain S-box-containing protein
MGSGEDRLELQRLVRRAAALLLVLLTALAGAFTWELLHAPESEDQAHVVLGVALVLGISLAVVTARQMRRLSAAYDRALAQAGERAELLAESEARFRLFVEGLHDAAMYMLDTEGRVRSWNLGAQRVIGYHPGEVLGRHFRAFITPEDQAMGVPERELADAAAQGSIEREAWRVRRDGGRFWAHVTVAALRDPEGRLVGYARLVRDATERKRGEQRRAAHLAAARVLSGAFSFGEALPRLLPALALELGFDAARAFVPAGGGWAAAASWARSAEDAARLGAEDAGLRLAPGEGLAGAAGVSGAAVVADAGGGGRERISARGGPWQAALAFAVPADGGLAAVLELFSREPLPRAESLVEAAQDLGVQLGTMVERVRVRESLARAERERAASLEQAVAARDQFLSIASHELKTPLTSMVLQLQSLLRTSRPAAEQDPRLEQKLKAVTRSTERLGELVNKLLDVSRITAGALEIVPESVDLASLVREVAARFAEVLAESGSPLLLRAPEPVVGSWDRMRLDAIVANLVSNAIKYGEGKPIEVEVDGDPATARLRVRDRGIGIAAEDQVRIFERFERAVPDRHYGGFGVGLWIARLIAEAHGGGIRVESSKGEGSTFIVELPRQPRAPVALPG